jgi:hypothetical protein
MLYPHFKNEKNRPAIKQVCGNKLSKLSQVGWVEHIYNLVFFVLHIGPNIRTVKKLLGKWSYRF